MVNVSEWLQRRHTKQAKGTVINDQRLDQKVEEPGTNSFALFVRRCSVLGVEATPKPSSVSYLEHGKPVGFSSEKATRK